MSAVAPQCPGCGYSTERFSGQSNFPMYRAYETIALAIRPPRLRLVETAPPFLWTKYVITHDARLSTRNGTFYNNNRHQHSRTAAVTRCNRSVTDSCDEPVPP